MLEFCWAIIMPGHGRKPHKADRKREKRNLGKTHKQTKESKPGSGGKRQWKMVRQRKSKALERERAIREAAAQTAMTQRLPEIVKLWGLRRKDARTAVERIKKRTAQIIQESPGKEPWQAMNDAVVEEINYLETAGKKKRGGRKKTVRERIRDSWRRAQAARMSHEEFMARMAKHHDWEAILSVNGVPTSETGAASKRIQTRAAKIMRDEPARDLDNIMAEAWGDELEELGERFESVREAKRKMLGKK